MGDFGNLALKSNMNIRYVNFVSHFSILLILLDSGRSTSVFVPHLLHSNLDGLNFETIIVFIRMIY